jgi:hypothetical protein
MRFQGITPLLAVLINFPRLIEHGFKDIRIVEFYKDKCSEMTKVTNATDLQMFYRECNRTIHAQFNNTPGKDKFLKLLMMLLVGRSPYHQNLISDQHITVAFELFKNELEDTKIKTEFKNFFKTGAMHPINSLDAFIEKVTSFLNTPSPHQESFFSNKLFRI